MSYRSVIAAGLLLGAHALVAMPSREEVEAALPSVRAQMQSRYESMASSGCPSSRTFAHMMIEVAASTNSSLSSSQKLLYCKAACKLYMSMGRFLPERRYVSRDGKMSMGRSDDDDNALGALKTLKRLIPDIPGELLLNIAGCGYCYVMEKNEDAFAVYIDKVKALAESEPGMAGAHPVRQRSIFPTRNE